MQSYIQSLFFFFDHYLIVLSVSHPYVDVVRIGVRTRAVPDGFPAAGQPGVPALPAGRHVRGPLPQTLRAATTTAAA